jgi:hypothetical protein
MRSLQRTLTMLAMFAAPALAGRRATAQMPGTPVLQNAFANPGITAALDVSSLGGASSYAAAGAWAPATGRFQVSGGIGLQTRTGAGTRTLYGARLNVPVVGATSSMGISLFAGFGGLSGGGIDSSVARTVFPLGATIGYRAALGTGHGVSIYASPVYEAITRGGNSGSASVFRGALGLDVGITSAIGATVGIEFGGKQAEGSGKPSGTAFGAALSYVIGRHR